MALAQNCWDLLLIFDKMFDRDTNFHSTALDYAVGHYENSLITQIILENYPDDTLKQLLISKVSLSMNNRGLRNI